MASWCQRAISTRVGLCRSAAEYGCRRDRCNRRGAATLSEISLISVLVFLTLTLAIEATYWIVWRSHRVHRSIGRRLAVSKRGSSAHEVLSTLREERGL